jgi:hypothetical protein
MFNEIKYLLNTVFQVGVQQVQVQWIVLAEVLLLEVLHIVECLLQEPEIVLCLCRCIRMNYLKVDVEEVFGQFALVHLS